MSSYFDPTDPLDNPKAGDDKSSGEGPKAPNDEKISRKRNRISHGPTRRALEDLCYSLWEASPDANVRAALVRWKARNL